MATADRSALEKADPIMLQLLQLATEVILTHPETVPPGLYEALDDWAADLAAAIGPPAGSKRDPAGHGEGTAADAST